MTADRWLVGVTAAALTVVTDDFRLAAINSFGVGLGDQLNGAPSTITIGPELGVLSNAGTDTGRAAKDIPISTNPLWAIPLGSLVAGRERPIFLPSRRVPAPGGCGRPRGTSKTCVHTADRARKTSAKPCRRRDWRFRRFRGIPQRYDA